MRYFNIPQTLALIDERLSDKAIFRIENSFREFGKYHTVESGWGVALDMRPHYYNNPDSGWDVTVLGVNPDHIVQMNIDIYGDGQEWWHEVTLEPVHGDFEDFTDSKCDEKEEENE